jgi:putative tryptophan/tyrosine transport system substrate-binding protein
MKRRDLIALLGGATVAWPVGVRAQQPMRVIGYLSAGSLETDDIPARLGAFRQGLGEMGYVEGQNVAIEFQGAEGENDRLPALAADLVQRRVSVIVTPGAPSALAAKAATSTIPIVFQLGDPLGWGLVASLNRPGGNLTGIASLTVELIGKRLELLHELVPTAAVVALLANPTNPSAMESESANFRDAARALGLEPHVLQASTPSEIEAAFETVGGLRAGALVVSGEALFTSRRTQIIALAARHSVPAVYGWREYPAEGGLMSYGTNLADAYRLTGIYVAKILKGASPAELPVEQTAKIELVINLKTAKALGLTIPLAMSGRADEVIE